MRTPQLLVFAAFCSVLSFPLSAQQSTSTSTVPATSDPQAVALIQQSLAALTGGTAVTDVTLTGTARRIAGSDDESGSATLEADSISDSRVDLSFSSGSRIEIRNHAALPLPDSVPPGVTLDAVTAATPQPVGARSGPNGVLHGMAAHNLMTDAAWFFPAITLGRLTASSAYVFSYVGQESHDGQSVIHLSALLGFSPAANIPGTIGARVQGLSQMDLFLDPATFLPVALDFNAHPHRNFFVDIAIEIRFSDYRPVNGIQVPFHVQRYVNNGLSLDLELTSAALNAGLSGSSFAIQ